LITRNGLVEYRDPLAGAREGDAVAAVLGLVPCGSESELEPATGDVIDGDRPSWPTRLDSGT
jgi:hypothetical protein